MSIALKTKDSSVLDEFEIPEHLGGVVSDLKKEQQTLKKEIEAVKSEPVVRKQDESTRVFNLRQHQIELKINQLEEKKKQTEKELQDILQQKNSTLHTDLKKLAQFILQESKKIAPLEKELEAKIGTISNLRNELQQIFESNLSDRKKNMDIVEAQSGQIRELGDLIRNTSTLLQGDFHFLTQDIGKLQTEKQAESRKLSELRQEVAHFQGLSDEIKHRRKELSDLEYQIAEGQKNAIAFAKLDDQMERVRSDIHRLHDEKEKLERNAERLKQVIFESEEGHSRLSLREKHLENVVSGKNDHLKNLESEIHDRRIHLEKIKEEEQKDQIRIHQHREELSQIRAEIARLEGSRTTYVMLLDESGKHFEEKKAFYQRESETLEKLHLSRIAEYESSFEKKKLQWDEEFARYSEEKKASLRSELEILDKQDLDDIRKKKTELLQEISAIMNTILAAPGFQSSEERSSRARKEVEKSFELVFGKTRRWKFW